MATTQSSATAVTQQDKTLDPITLSVIMSRFDSIVIEMTRTFELTAWSTIMALARDFSCAIYDSVPQQLSMGEAIPIHTTSMHIALADIHRTFEGDLHEGDVFLCNAPYRGNTHVGDVVTAEPVFAEGRHMFWSCTKGHQADVGAFIPSSVTPSAKDIWQEGLQIPPVRIYNKGKPILDVIDFYLSNLRYVNALRGDLYAQIGSIGTGRDRLVELVSEYGADELQRYMDEILGIADRRMAQEIRQIPDGEYEAEAWVDSDGDKATNLSIKAKVTVDDDKIFVDYSGSAPQSPRALNSSFATGQAAAAIPFLSYIDPHIPHNAGCIRHIESYAPEGSMCNAKYPGATSGATQTPTDTMGDVVHKAMASAIPDKVVAGGVRSSHMPIFAGVDERTGEGWSGLLVNGSGGAGAGKGVDGWPLWVGPAGAGGCKSMQVEQLELIYPILVTHEEIEPDSMGAGTWIGGPGVRFATLPTHGPMEAVAFGDGQLNPPHGVCGGTMGCGGGQYVEEPSGHRRYMSVTANYRVEMGELRVGVSTGGGGYGNPIEREAELVRQNVRDGWVTREQAADVFGVVLSDDWDPVIDEEATSARRAELAKIERPLLDPPGPAASTWLEGEMREGDVYLLNPEVG